MSVPVVQDRPKVFIGSSTQSVDVARCVQALLDDSCDSTVWTHGFFELSFGTLESLAKRAEEFDFAVLVFGADDHIKQPNNTDAEWRFAPRDNVIFELGLFMGRLGHERVFILYNSTAEPKAPSDLAGVTYAAYRLGGTRSLVDALGPPCFRIAEAIRKRGVSDKNRAPDRVEARVQSIVNRAMDVLDQIDSLAFRSHYVGPFPTCFEKAIDLIASARKSIHVVCDFPCYGYFSRRELYHKYRNHLIEKRSAFADITAIKIIVPNDTHRTALQKLQFANSQAEWDKLMSDQVFSDLLAAINNDRGTEPLISTMEAFHSYLLAVQRFMLDEPSLKACIRQIDEIPGVYSWVVDGERAVFTLPRLGKNAEEQGFYTSEPAAIKSLESVTDFFWRDEVAKCVVA